MAPANALPVPSAQMQTLVSQTGLFAGSDQPGNDAESVSFAATAPAREAANFVVPTLGAHTSGRPELARHIGLQLASASSAQSGGQVELRLNPEELGRVRLSLTPGDGTMVVSIVAERGETLDLMRRHINLLAEEFQELGYSNLQFDFGTPERDDDTSRPASQNSVDDALVDADVASAAIARAPSARPGSNGLDLRF